MTWGSVELEPEVRKWLEALPTALFAEKGPLLGEPYTKQIDGKLRELRFYLESEAIRLTYWIATGRRIILLTVFRKSRWREEREVDRARRAWAKCVAEEHTAQEEGQ